MAASVLLVLTACSGSSGSGSATDAQKSATQNSPPQISGVPTTFVIVGESYDFRPSASDPDNDPLTFSIENGPSWATFNTSTGRIGGTPQAGDVGFYDGIVLRVSDGQSTASLPSFDITVDQTGAATITLHWQPPTENEDGTPLTDLAGYRIYYGKRSGRPDQQVSLNNPGLTTYLLENLSPGTYYLSMTAFNSAMLESRRTQEAALLAK